MLICPSGLSRWRKPADDRGRAAAATTTAWSARSFTAAGLRAKSWSAPCTASSRIDRWKKGVLRTLRGTVGHSVAPLLPLVSQQTLVIWGAEDRVLTDVPGAVAAGRANSPGPPGRDPQMRPRAADRARRAGQSTDLAVPPRRAQDDSAGPRAGPIPESSRARSPIYAGGSLDGTRAFPAMNPMSDFTLFLGKFFRHGTAIASVAPSSRWLSRLTVAKHRLGHAPNAGRAGRRHRADHPRDRRAGPAGMPRHGRRARPRFRPAAHANDFGEAAEFRDRSGRRRRSDWRSSPTAESRPSTT